MSYRYEFECEKIFVPASKVSEMLSALLVVAKQNMKYRLEDQIGSAKETSQNERYSEDYRLSRKEKANQLSIELESLKDIVLSREEVLANLGWQLQFDDGGNMVSLYHSESSSQDREVLEAIAPFAHDGGYVEMQGEDRGDIFRYVFRDGKMHIVQGVISFPGMDE